MKTQIFVAFVIALLLPASAYGQCQTNFGDCGVAGQFISDGIVTDGGCGACNCSPICGGPYISIFGGLAQLQDQSSDDFARNNGSLGNEIEVGFADGFVIGASVGKRWNRYFRSEIEYVYRENDADSAILNGNLINAVAGKTHSNNGMINGFCDLPIANGFLVPYIGAGIGVTGIESDVQAGRFPPAQSMPINNGTLDGNDSSLAYQWMVGLTYRAFPNAEFFVEYRYFEANDPQLPLSSVFAVDDILGNIDSILDSEYVSKDVFLGIRMNF